jgi:hypothetical protein
MGFRGSSRSPGPRPNWLRRAADVRFTQVTPGPEDSTLLHFTAPRFGEIAQEIYRQGELFGTLPRESDTAFDVMGDMLFDVAGGRRDSDRFDTRVLRHLESLREPVFHHGVDEVSLLGGRLPDGSPPTLNANLSEIAVSLYRQTPAPVRARIAGRLDMIRSSDRVFALVLSNGQRVRGIWLGQDVETLRLHFGSEVVINGTVSYRPSGSVLRIDAQALDAASEADRLFSKLPPPAGPAMHPSDLYVPQTACAGMSAVFGKWPGDESDEDALRTLAEVE